MTPPTPATGEPPSTHSLWTVARICRALNHTVLERRFLTDLTHAPEPEVMSVFTAWRKIAATIEQHAPGESHLEDLALPARVQPLASEGQ